MEGVAMPSSVRIGPHRLTIKRGPLKNIGEMHIDTLTIRLRNGLLPSMERETALPMTPERSCKTCSTNPLLDLRQRL